MVITHPSIHVPKLLVLMQTLWHKDLALFCKHHFDTFYSRVRLLLLLPILQIALPKAFILAKNVLNGFIAHQRRFFRSTFGPVFWLHLVFMTQINYFRLVLRQFGVLHCALLRSSLTLQSFASGPQLSMNVKRSRLISLSRRPKEDFT